VIGIALAILVDRSKLLSSVMRPYIIALQAAMAGLGHLIANCDAQLRTASAFAALAMLVLLGVASDGVVLTVKRRVVFRLGKV
jgi:ABC-type nitrate/sulfonate/bicarbonate transport system permease component